MYACCLRSDTMVTTCCRNQSLLHMIPICTPPRSVAQCLSIHQTNRSGLVPSYIFIIIQCCAMSNTLPIVCSDVTNMASFGHRYTVILLWMAALHNGHSFNCRAHPSQQHTCPQGTKATFAGVDRHTLHSTPLGAI